jgi:hypothetical protein
LEIETNCAAKEIENACFGNWKKGNVMKNNLKRRVGTKWQIGIASAVALLLVAGTASAQSSSDASANLGALFQKFTQTTQGNGGGGAVAFGGSMVASYAKPVTGAPYSAQIVTETVQPFADGNSITHTSTSSVYRDSQGRTRREQNINIVGPSQVSGAPIQFITIDDPVAGVHYTLNPNKMTGTEIATSGTVSSTPADTFVKKVIPSDGSNVTITYFSSGDGVAVGGGRGGGGGTLSIASGEVSAVNVTTESLGADTMQGLSVLGTRITRTIPAGQIGNAQPILIITDRWYSQDLQIEVKMVHSDPRTGTTTTTLTNLSRNEPNPSLFTVPPGYTINNSGNAGGKFVLKQQEPL